MTDCELSALTAAVTWQSAMLNADIAQYGERQTDPNTSEAIALHDELRRRISAPKPPSGDVFDTSIRYNELIMAVASKHVGESRHETALRYIIERESAQMPPHTEPRK